MIFIVVKWPVLPAHSDSWLDLTKDFTRETRAEAGNLLFEWSRSTDDPNDFVLIEAFADSEAGAAHVQSEHFKTAMDWMPDYVSATPRIVHTELPGAQDWSEMSEVNPR